MTEKNEKTMMEAIYITLPKKLTLTMEDKFKKAQFYNSATVPNGVILNGQDIGGMTFQPKFLTPSKKNENYMTASYFVPEDADTKINLYKPNEKGVAENTPREKMQVSLRELKEAIDEHQREFFAQKQRENENKQQSEETKDVSKENTNRPKAMRKEKDEEAEF